MRNSDFNDVNRIPYCVTKKNLHANPVGNKKAFLREIIPKNSSEIRFHVGTRFNQRKRRSTTLQRGQRLNPNPFFETITDDRTATFDITFTNDDNIDVSRMYPPAANARKLHWSEKIAHDADEYDLYF
ncbi:uncharacterized protein LOC144424591 [Styela clava]